jgi:uncharacterized membrane protein YjjP (DUF1212 family)
VNDEESLVKITHRERMELAALEVELSQIKETNRKNKLHVLSAIGFAIAGSAAALGGGAGLLGVMFVAGVVVGVTALAKST